MVHSSQLCSSFHRTIPKSLGFEAPRRCPSSSSVFSTAYDNIICVRSIPPFGLRHTTTNLSGFVFLFLKSRVRGKKLKMSRSLLRRVTPLIRFRIEQNRRLLTSAAEELSSETPGAVYMTDSCVRRLKELNAVEECSEGKMLRLSVETGGCSGFQYAFLLDAKRNEDDRIFEKDGVKLVVDNISYDFVKGATVDYAEELIRSAFQVTTNPSAVGGCSCKSSFMVK